jgi:putative oxidoreductase
MKNLMSVGFTKSAFNIAMFVLRVGAGILIIHHGYDKLVHFHDMEKFMVNFMGLGKSVSLSLVIFAEFFCAIFLILGLFTRFAAIPLIIDTTVAVIEGHKLDILGQGEHAALFILIFLVVLILGPGRISVDGMINK